MRQKPGTKRSHGEKVVKDIRRATRKQHSSEEKIRIVLDGLKSEDSKRFSSFVRHLKATLGSLSPQNGHTQQQCLGFERYTSYQGQMYDTLEQHTLFGTFGLCTVGTSCIS